MWAEKDYSYWQDFVVHSFAQIKIKYTLGPVKSNGLRTET